MVTGVQRHHNLHISHRPLKYISDISSILTHDENSKVFFLQTGRLRGSQDNSIYTYKLTIHSTTSKRYMAITVCWLWSWESPAAYFLFLAFYETQKNRKLVIFYIATKWSTTLSINSQVFIYSLYCHGFGFWLYMECPLCLKELHLICQNQLKSSVVLFSIYLNLLENEKAIFPK